MKRLIRASKWMKEVFPEGGVGIVTVEGWVRNQIIPGAIIDGTIFVDADRAALLLENNVVLQPAITLEQVDMQSSGNANIARIVQAGLDLQPRSARG